MTPTPSAPVSLFSAVDRRFVAQSVVISFVATTVILAVAAPGLRSHWPALRLHAPELWRIAAAAPAIKIHLAGIAAAFAIGLILLAGTKGRLMHRVLGWTWVLAMGAAAVSSLFIRVVNHGHLSWIHLLTGWTLIALPMGVAFARTHRVKMHARIMTGLFLGGLVVAGLFTFVPGRLMWQVIFA